MALCFTASGAIHAWEFVYHLSEVGSSYQLHYQFVLLQLVSSVVRHSAVNFRATCISA
jgi:hypothetical protein